MSAACVALDGVAADDVGAEAEVLFRAAVKLMDSGNYAAACPKLAESQRLDPGNGTLARLATCHEKEGKVATAWSEFSELLDDARRAGQWDREKYARARLEVLQPLLSRLTIEVPADVAALPGLLVRRDGVAVRPAAWGIAIPVDPGEHVLEAAADGHRPWSTRVTIGATADSQVVTLPGLEVVPAPVPPRPPRAESGTVAPNAPETASAPPDRAPWSTRHTLAVLLAATGVAGVALGSYYGFRALSDSSDAHNACPTAACTNAAAVETNDEAKSSARAADVLLPVGVAAVAVGSVLYFLAPPGSLRVEPVAGRTSGVRVTASW
ncbi:MAG TPA: hypothetical protein VE995_01555 [Gaiellaceae bacterium]|nr:hypothetical protein [Gaiellaceae bacterium]